MDASPISELTKVFLDYVDTFDNGDRDLRSKVSLKRTHSLRVCEEIAALARDLHLDAATVELARVAGLLHDIGRFEQYNRFRTFSDLHSVDHGALGAAIVGQTGLLDGFPKAEQGRILDAIRCHNRQTVGADACRDHPTLLLTQLLRDADKLDILRIVVERLHPTGQDEHERLPRSDEAGVSAEVIDCLLRKQIVPVEKVRTFVDRILMRLSWVFDLNFIPAMQRLVRRGYVDGLQRRVPTHSGIECAFQIAREHIQTRIVIASLAADRIGQSFWSKVILSND